MTSATSEERNWFWP